jgi:hypothetical protein
MTNIHRIPPRSSFTGGSGCTKRLTHSLRRFPAHIIAICVAVCATFVRGCCESCSHSHLSSCLITGPLLGGHSEGGAMLHSRPLPGHIKSSISTLFRPLINPHIQPPSGTSSVLPKPRSTTTTTNGTISTMFDADTTKSRKRSAAAGAKLPPSWSEHEVVRSCMPPDRCHRYTDMS